MSLEDFVSWFVRQQDVSSAPRPMVVLDTILVILGMALIGVRVLLGVLTPLFGGQVERRLPEESWDGTMFFFAQSTAAVATFLVGFFAVGLPWYAAVIAALVVGATTYARRAEP